MGTCLREVPRDCSVRPPRPSRPLEGKDGDGRHDKPRARDRGRRRRAHRHARRVRARRLRKAAWNENVHGGRGRLSPDARLAARHVLAQNRIVIAKDTTGIVEAIRQLRVVRDGAIKERSAALHALDGLIVSAPDELRQQLVVRKTTRGRATLCARFRPDSARLHEPAVAASHRQAEHRATAKQKRRSPRCVAPARPTISTGRTDRHPLDYGGNATPTARCTWSPSGAYATANARAPTPSVGPPKARPKPRSSAASSATSRASSTTPLLADLTLAPAPSTTLRPDRVHHPRCPTDRTDHPLLTCIGTSRGRSTASPLGNVLQPAG